MHKSELKAPVSIVILTFNEELNIEVCLKSVSGWCEEIFVVDSGSTDQTLEFCSRYTDKIYTHPYIDHSSQIDWSLKNLPIACEWVLLLDADNVVSETLKVQISQALAQDPPDIDGYYSYHRHLFRNRRVRGLKCYWLRLIRRKNTRMDQSELVDFRLVLKGNTRTLTGEIVEYNRKEDDLDFWIDKHQKFSSRMAVEEILRKNGFLKWSSDLRPHLHGNPDERMLWLKNHWYRLPIYVRPFLYFFYRYFFQLGFLDGVNGFLYHFLQSFWFRLIVDVKIARLREQIASREVSIEQLKDSFIHKF